MNKIRFIACSVFIFSIFCSPISVFGRDARMPLSIRWKSERVVPDGSYTLTLETELSFARLTPASMIVTPTDIALRNHSEIIPKGTIFAWDTEHKIACEPIRRRKMSVFYCLEDSKQTGKFDTVSVIQANGLLRRPGYMLTGISYEYLLGRFFATAPSAINEIEIQSFPSGEQFESFDVSIRFEWQYKVKEAAYSLCTARNLGKNLFSFGHDQIKALCTPEVIEVHSVEFPKVMNVFGFNITLVNFDDNYTHLNLAKISD